MEDFYSTVTCILVWLDPTAHALIWGQDVSALKLEHLKPVLSGEDLNARRIPNSPLDLQLNFLAQYLMLRSVLTLQDDIQEDLQWVSDTVLSKAASGDAQAKATASSSEVTRFCRELKTLTKDAKASEQQFKKAHALHNKIMTEYDKAFKAFNQKWVKKISDTLNKAGTKFVAEHEADFLHSLNSQSPSALTERAGGLKIKSRKGEMDKALIGKKGISEKDAPLYRVVIILIEKSPLSGTTPSDVKKAIGSLLKEMETERATLAKKVNTEQKALGLDQLVTATNALERKFHTQIRPIKKTLVQAAQPEGILPTPKKPPPPPMPER